MGAQWSIDQESVTTPWVGTRPNVGLKPTTPESAAGTRIEARVSVPREPGAMPVATAMAEPPAGAAWDPCRDPRDCDSGAW